MTGKETFHVDKASDNMTCLAKNAGDVTTTMELKIKIYVVIGVGLNQFNQPFYAKMSDNS